MMQPYITNRITINPQQCGGRPCIRGMRIRVVDILELQAAGLTPAEILEELPDLEMADLQAVAHFAAHRVNHLILPEAKESVSRQRHPGSAKGILTIVAEDDEHLADFKAYMPSTF
jgi:uncharacterized protein (DUF433 family)